MFWKWEKQPEDLYFTVHSAKVSKNTTDEFELSWARGDHAGSTFKKIPDADGFIKFDHEFSCPCTMYVNKKDDTVRPKNIKFVLKRYTSVTENKIYGKLTIDVAPYYKKRESVHVNFEMESGRSTPPELSITFTFKASTREAGSSTVNDQDMSFIGDTPERKVALDEWDRTDFGAVEANSVQQVDHGESTLSSFQRPAEKKRKHDKEKHDKEKHDKDKHDKDKKHGHHKSKHHSAEEGEEKPKDAEKKHKHHSSKKATEDQVSADVEVKAEVKAEEKPAEKIEEPEVQKYDSTSEKEAPAPQHVEEEKVVVAEDEKPKKEEEKPKKEDDEPEKVEEKPQQQEEKAIEEEKPHVEEEKHEEKKEEVKSDTEEKSEGKVTTTIEKTEEAKEEVVEEEKKPEPVEEEKKVEEEKVEEEKIEDDHEDEDKPKKKAVKKGRFGKFMNKKKKNFDVSESSESSEEENPFTPPKKAEPTPEKKQEPTSEKKPEEKKVEIPVNTPPSEKIKDEPIMTPKKEGEQQQQETPKTPKVADSKLLDLIQETLIATWPEYKSKAFIDRNGKVAVPPAALPLCAVALHCEIFKNKPLLEEYVNLLPQAPLSLRSSHQQRFYTYLILSAFASRYSKEYPQTNINNSQPNLNITEIQKNVEEFLNHVDKLVDESMTLFLKPLIPSFEVILNRLITARFNSEMLMNDFSQVMRNSRTTIQGEHTAAVHRVACRRLQSMLDARVYWKIMSNPNRFSFTNGAAWSSFCTALEGECGVALPLSSQLAHLLMMAAQVADDFHLREEICPDIPPAEALYVIERLLPDDMMPIRADAQKFAAAVGLKTGTVKEDVRNPEPVDVSSLYDGGLSEAWKKCTVDDVLVDTYPFLQEYKK